MEILDASVANWSALYILGGIVATILLVYALVTMVLLIVIGGQPKTAAEGFALLQKNRVIGLLRLDILIFVIMPLYYPLFLALYAALRETHLAYASLATLLAFAGITLVLATPSALSFAALGDRFAVATTEAQKSQFLAAGEAILASDSWHGTGASVGGVLAQTAGVLVSIIMLGNPSFRGATAYVGIVTHGLDLAHILLGFFFPKLGVILMSIAGPLYLVWFPLLALDLLRLA
jgi:hypothetical protein